MEVYVDFMTPSAIKLPLTSTDSQWVGAWWVGFIIFGVLNFIVAPPFFAFPKKLPQPSDQRNFDVATEAAESLDVVDIEAEREVDVTSAVDRQRTSDPTEHDERASVAEQICAESKCSSIKGNFYLCAKGYFIFIAVIQLSRAIYWCTASRRN